MKITESETVPKYYVKRMENSEKGPPYAWRREPSISYQVQFPARNIVKTGLNWFHMYFLPKKKQKTLYKIFKGKVS